MQQMQDSSLPIIPLWLVWLTALFFVGYGLGSYAILDNNEGLYAEIPREMLRSGDWRQWVIPHLNGLMYVEKPPLLYWLTALSFWLFGESELAARLVPALSSLSCVALLLWFSRVLGRIAAGRLAAIMFVTGLGVSAMSRTLMFDMLLAALLAGAMTHGYLFTVGARKKSLYWCYSLLALALLAKGFVALILFSAVMGSFLLVQSRSVRDFFRVLGLWLNWKALALFVLIAAPWHIAATLAEPIFAWFYFINEHVLRFLGRREPHDYYAGAWWYYLPRMLIYLFPWSFFLPVVLFARSVRPAERPLQWFLTLSWVLPVLFFSVSSAKANYYLVVVMPLAALQLAIALEDRNCGSRAGRAVPGLLMAILLGVAVWSLSNSGAAWLSSVRIGSLDGVAFALVCLSIMAGCAVAGAVLAYRFDGIGILAYLTVPVTGLFMLLGILRVSAEWTSTRPLAEVLQSEYAAREVYLYRVFENQSSLPFYLKKPVKVVESRSSDLYWGNRLHSNRIVWPEADFQMAARQQPVVLLVLNQDLPDFESKTYYGNFRKNKKMGNVTLFLN